MAKDYLSIIFDKIDLTKEHREFIVNSLFKYRNNPVIEQITKIVNDNKSHIEEFHDILTEIGVAISGSAPLPLAMFTPSNPNTIRVYPNIIFSLHDKTSRVEVTSVNCVNIFKDFIAEYEKDLLHEQRKVRWTPIDNAEKRLNTYIDMSTATALSRYLGLAEAGHKPHKIRDFATTIDELRKPMKITFAETPEDFLTMYSKDPTSCMSNTNAADRANWKFLNEQGVCPTSFYAFYPYSKGAYAKVNGRVVARAVMFQHPTKKTWQFGRVFSSNSEYHRKFVATLESMGYSYLGEGTKHHTPVGTTFAIKGYKKDSLWAAPFPYFDNMSSDNWSATFDTTTKEFTVTYNATDKNRIPCNRRPGYYILSTDYIKVECSNCGNIVTGKAVLTCKDETKIFCSDACANQEGFIKVIQGNGVEFYDRPAKDKGYIDVLGNTTVKYSTIRAAQEHSFYPIIEEFGVIPEQGSAKVFPTRTRHYIGSGEYVGFLHTPNITISNIALPIKVTKQKTVVYDAEADIVMEI